MKRGFTLIELSIVLVIIGLIVGGVLVGRDMIENAVIRRQVTDFDKIKAAMYAFRNKYNCIPGDCAKATVFGVTTGAFPIVQSGIACQPGDGNGLINGQENLYFACHLVNANLLEIPRSTYTGNNGFIWLLGQLPDTMIRLNSINNASTNVVSLMSNSVVWNGGSVWTVAGVNAMRSYMLDAKMDDGLPTTGTVYAVGNEWNGTWDNTTFTNITGVLGDTTTCIAGDVTPPVYNTTNPNPRMCAPTFNLK